MASARPGNGPSRIPGAETRMRGCRTAEDATAGLSGPFSHRPQAQRPRVTEEEKLLPSQGPSSKIPSRIPQTLSTRKPPAPAPAPASASTLTCTPKSVLTKNPPAESRSASATSTPRSGANMISIPSPIVFDAQSTATKPKPARNVVRRKHSSISQGSPSRHPSPWEPPLPEPPSPRTSSSSSDPRSGSGTSLDPGYVLSSDRSITASPAEIRIAHSIEVAVTTARPITILPEPSAVVPAPFVIPELDRYRGLPRPSAPEPLMFGLPLLTTLDLPPPPTPEWYSSEASATSASPSTRFSESPGLSAFSRETTPTSMSSQSPGLAAPFRMPPGIVRSGSPSRSRPPVTRRRGGSASNLPEDLDELRGLPSVRESTTSSSSNSTIRAGPKDVTPPQRKAPPPRLDPPPRKSSHRYDTAEKGKDGSQVFQKKERPTVVRIHSPGRPLASSTMSSRFRSPPTTPTVLAIPPTPTPKTAIKGAAPVRPSREGTVDIRSQILPIPIIHSNLSAASLNGERRGSEPTISNSIPRSATSVSLPDTYKQPSRVPAAGKEVPAVKFTVTTTTTENKLTKSDPRSRHVRTPSPLIGSHSLFPFFRRNKTSTDSQAAERKEKVARKGPAAGTGHEGYGRFGARRRSSTSSASGFRSGSTPVSSQESLASDLTTDPFLLERMNPVIIAGGEIKENRNFSIDLPRRSESSQSANSVAVASPDPSLGGGNRNTLWPGAPLNAMSRDRRPSDVSDSEVLIKKPKTLARRSIQRLRSSIGPAGLGIKNHMRNDSVVSGSSTSLDSAPVSEDLHADPRPSLTRDRVLALPATFGPKKLLNRAKSPQRKWNLFGRSQKAQQEQQQAAPEDPTANATVTASVRPLHHKIVAYYMMDSSEQPDVNKFDAKEYHRNDPPLVHSPPSESPSAVAPVPPTITHTPVSPAAPFAPLAEPIDIPHTEPISPLRTVETLSFGVRTVTPDPPTAPPQIEPPPPPVPKVSTFMLRSGKPSRLPQVGRIPKAIQQPVEPPSPTKIFSRPFNRSSTSVAAHEPVCIDPESIGKGPSPPQPSTPEGNDFWTPDVEAQARVHVRPQTNATRGTTPDLSRAKDMWSFSPMKHGSMATSCTTSTSFSGITTMADATTAAMPIQDEAPIDDEVWDEYDDLIDDEAIDRFARVNSNAMWLLSGRNKGFIPASGGDVQPIPRALDDAIYEDEAATCSSIYTDDMTERIMAAFGGMDQQPTSTLPPVATTPPLAAKEFVPGHGHSLSVDSGTVKILSRGSVDSYATRRSGRSSRSSEDESPVAQVNLRVGSMSVSKWLTFGHVLFSPVRDGLVAKEGSLKRHSVLVIDGLGNDDWSFYAAETYPSATFFNLSPRPPLPSERRNSTSVPLTPPNHHQIQYMSHLDKFPFAPESFKSVVYRFPVAVPESHYCNIIAEARRVLQPGGYLEMSILDADLNNMGNRGRRAIRKLKERTNTCEPGTSLTPAADLVLRQLGGQGFADIKTCRVGVPVASPIARTGSLKREGGKSGRTKKKKEKGIRTLAEMMDEEGDAADENITRMVARVGRWWYHRCYESPVGVDSISNSIWADRALLDECEGLGTSLKLTVCYAKVPGGRARLASI